MITKTTDLGDINLSLDVVASITGGAATECYGVCLLYTSPSPRD